MVHAIPQMSGTHPRRILCTRSSVVDLGYDLEQQQGRDSFMALALIEESDSISRAPF